MKQLISITALLSFLAHGEFPPPSFPDASTEDEPAFEDRKPSKPPKPQKPDKPEQPVEPPSQAFRERINIYLVGGLSTLSSNGAAIENELSTVILKDHFALGAFGRYQFSRIFGVEVDAFHATTPIQTEDLAPVDDPAGDETRQLTQWGVMLGVRAEHSFPNEMATFRPSVSVGYGLVNFNQVSGTAAGEGIQNARVSGIYGSLGLEAFFQPSVLAFADYAMSLGATGLFDSSGLAVASVGLSGTKFTRFRIGVSVKTWDWLSVGGMIVMRSFTANTTATRLLFGQGEQQMQFMLFAGAEF